jgi:hypothetical protein
VACDGGWLVPDLIAVTPDSPAEIRVLAVVEEAARAGHPVDRVRAIVRLGRPDDFVGPACARKDPMEK